MVVMWTSQSVISSFCGLRFYVVPVGNLEFYLETVEEIS